MIVAPGVCRFLIAAFLVAACVDATSTFAQGGAGRSWLGVSYEMQQSSSGPNGAIVRDAVPDGPAYRGGIRTGDLLLKFGDSDLVDQGMLARLVSEAPLGSQIPVLLLRDGKRLRLVVTLGNRPAYLDAQLRGRALAEKGQYAEAIAEYDAALAHKPDDPECLRDRGAALGVLGLLDRSLADLDKAIQLNPKGGWAYVQRGVTWARKGDWQKSLADFDRAEQRGGFTPAPDFFFARAISLEHLGRMQEALLNYEQAAILAPGNAEFQQQAKRLREVVHGSFPATNRPPTQGVASPPPEAPPQSPRRAPEPDIVFPK